PLGAGRPARPRRRRRPLVRVRARGYSPVREGCDSTFRGRLGSHGRCAGRPGARPRALESPLAGPRAGAAATVSLAAVGGRLAGRAKLIGVLAVPVLATLLVPLVSGGVVSGGRRVLHHSPMNHSPLPIHQPGQWS